MKLRKIKNFTFTIIISIVGLSLLSLSLSAETKLKAALQLKSTTKNTLKAKVEELKTKSPDMVLPLISSRSGYQNVTPIIPSFHVIIIFIIELE